MLLDGQDEPVTSMPVSVGRAKAEGGESGTGGSGMRRVKSKGEISHDDPIMNAPSC